jgi:hypothetical protein
MRILNILYLKRINNQKLLIELMYFMYFNKQNTHTYINI